MFFNVLRYCCCCLPDNSTTPSNIPLRKMPRAPFTSLLMRRPHCLQLKTFLPPNLGCIHPQRLHVLLVYASLTILTSFPSSSDFEISFSLNLACAHVIIERTVLLLIFRCFRLAIWLLLKFGMTIVSNVCTSQRAVLRWHSSTRLQIRCHIWA